MNEYNDYEEMSSKTFYLNLRESPVVLMWNIKFIFILRYIYIYIFETHPLF